MARLFIDVVFLKHTCVFLRSSKLDDWRKREYTASVADGSALMSKVKVPWIRAESSELWETFECRDNDPVEEAKRLKLLDTRKA